MLTRQSSTAGDQGKREDCYFDEKEFWDIELVWRNSGPNSPLFLKRGFYIVK